ncbi:radical SAM protein [Anaerocolumna sp. AGMB13025]|uniref:radical SAM/SPASM domain-containing protein n=1 Tax=Anaerocolumna sp. AGMB13025 TaxID=3039116 RepID=UPI00241E598A|nr:radical SAM protein [Anaerocolumna sp. AGMB13025]WFR56987.1 radical SAM protein [Anaerocolumna sp. AGMB13025]
MEEVMDKYVGIFEGTLMYLTNKKCNILMEKEENGENSYRFFTINQTGRNIMECITGNTSTGNLIKKFCNINAIPMEENQDWILEFIYSLKEKGAVYLADEPIAEHCIKVIGEEKLISPMHATVEITETCNLRCRHCYLDASVLKDKCISFKQFEEIVNQLKENKVVNIELTGGELFMNPEAYEIVQLALKQFAMVGILTNGTILTEAMLALLSNFKEKVLLNVSLDSVNPQLHDDFRGQKGAFDKTCETIKRLTGKGLNVRVASSIFRDNMWEIDKLADLAVSLGARVFTYNFVEDFGRGNQVSSAKTDKSTEVKNYTDYINGVIRKYRNIIPVIQSDDFISGSSNCGAGTVSILIGADGNLRPCALFPKIQGLGNINKEKFSDIFQKEIYKLIADIKPPSEANGCPNSCKYLYHCRGCYLKGLEKNKDSVQPCSWINFNRLEPVLEFYKGNLNYV